MAISYPRVPLVSSGERVTSTHWNKLAESISSRLRYNLGDPNWRIVFYLFNLFRQIRNSDGLFTFPPEAEFFQVYQMLSPDAAQWPVAEPGEAEGANIASLMPQFVFGNPRMDSEDLRIADPASGGVPLWLGLTVPSTPAEIWELGKQQRGAYDPNDGNLGSPSFTAATSHFNIASSVNGTHGNSYGGYMPAPLYLGDCADGETPNYQIFFTNLDTGATRTYSGTCPENPTDVAAIGRTPFAYWVFLNDGTIEVLPAKDWIDGPYEGGAWVTRRYGDHVQRVLNAFAADFNGTEDQKYPEVKSWLANAFDFQKFLSSQYHLAPNIGVSDGVTIGPTYPLFRLSDISGRVSPNTFATHVQTNTQDHQYASGFTCASCLITATKLKAKAVLKLWDNDGIIQTIEIVPDAGGSFSQIITIDNFPAGNLMEWQCTSGADFVNSTGKIEIECTEILEYKPEIHDLYLVLRLASCKVNLANGTDGAATDETKSKEISDSYFTNACILNANNSPGPSGSFAEINTNAVFEAARRLSKSVRMMPRRNFVGYAVENGKSVLYFKRMSFLQNANGIDLFEGIAPAREQIQSGDLKRTRSYIVRTGTVTYKGTNYTAGQTFVADSTKEFQGDGELYEYEGIRSVAEPEGYSNEWVTGQQLKVYHPSESSEWKPDAYSDYWFWSERCHFYHHPIASPLPADLRRQFQYGSPISFAPEAPTGWRYAKNTNLWECAGDPTCEANRIKRYKSCRIYEPDPEIESATVQIESGEEIVKLVYKTRFHSHDTLAPASIDRDVSTWNLTDLAAEAADYRTVENGLREYLAWAFYGVHCTSGNIDDSAGAGNSTHNAAIWSDPDNPHGACFPDFYFVKLIPKVPEDGNDKQDSTDAPLWAEPWRQTELYLRAICEGFVDGRTSAEIGCLVGTSALFDYTFESACFEAFGGKWFNTLATTVTGRLKDSDVRDDSPQGFGPVPNTFLSSEIFNQFASFTNLLNRVRVMLPMKFEVQTYGDETTKPFDAVWPSSPPSCSTGGPVAAYGSDTPPDPGASTILSAWHDATGVSSTHSGAVHCSECSGSQWKLVGTRTDEEWRWNFSDPDAQYAVPENWRDMVTANGVVLGIRQKVFNVENVRHVAFADSSNCQGINGYWFDSGTGDYLDFFETITVNSTACEVIPQSGKLSVAPMGKTILRIGRTAADEPCCGGDQNDESILPILGNDMAFIQIPLV